MKSLDLEIVSEMRSTQHFMEKLQTDTVSFEKLSAFLKKYAGINMITNGKNLTLMACRLAPILKKRSLRNYREYLDILAHPTAEILAEFVSALTTNTTQFFRESVHFDIFKNKLLETVEQKKKQHSYELRLWCAASSTGQEAYSILFTLLTHLPSFSNWNIHFLSSDIDTEVLEKASLGIYQENELENLPEMYRHQYFKRVVSQAKSYQIKTDIKKMVRFAQFNLLTDRYPFQHRFDFVFCRNVLIYFDRTTSDSVIEKIARTIRPGGYLFLGHSETGMMKSKFLKSIATGVYQKTEG